jgi:glycosyltransferase involved in cell wall biosynthesis
MRRAIFLFSAPFIPANSGVERRCLEMAEALRDIGYQVTIASLDPWPEERQAAARARFGGDVRVLRKNESAVPWLGRFHRVLSLRAAHRTRLSGELWSPWNLRVLYRQAFTELLEQVQPQLIFMSYWRTDGLVDHARFSRITRVIDGIDLATINAQMWEAVEKRLPALPVRMDALDNGRDGVLAGDFFSRHPVHPRREELAAYDRFDVSIAIAEAEAQIMRENTRRTRVVSIPMTMEAVPLENTYRGAAVLPTGPNPFNLQGLLYFARSVLPVVRDRHPEFSLQVTGTCSDQIGDAPGVERLGFVPSLADVYREAAFAVCPVFGGTGQQIKIVEAMAHGLPVVAVRFAADRSPIRDGVNGFAVESAEEFAERVCELWGDRGLCRRLGEAARDTIRREYAPERTRAALADVLGPAATPPAAAAATGRVA